MASGTIAMQAGIKVQCQSNTNKPQSPATKQSIPGTGTEL